MNSSEEPSKLPTRQPVQRMTQRAWRMTRQARDVTDQTAWHAFVVSQDEPGQRPNVFVPVEFIDSGMLGLVISFMERVGSAELPLEGAKLNKRGRLVLLPLGRALCDLLHIPPGMLLDKFHEHACHPLVGAYLRALETAETERLEFMLGEPEEIVSAFAHVLQRMHAELQSKALRTQIQNFKRTSKKCYASLMEMIKLITSKHAKVLSVRQDLSYRSAHPDSGRKHPSRQEAKVHLAKFLVHLRRKTGLRILGYCWAMEYAPSTGCLFHFWLFLNGHHHQNDIAIGCQLDQAWRTITDGEGRGYLCNRDKKRYAHLAVGMLHRGSIDWDGMHHTVKYFTKPDYFLQYCPKKGERTFGRSCQK